MNRLGIGSKKARTLLDDLCQMEQDGYPLLARPHTAFNRIETEIIRDHKIVGWRYETDYKGGFSQHYLSNIRKRAFNRWDLQNSSYKELWFNKDLVGEGRSPDKPLKILWRLCGNVATRLYLHLFCRNYLETNIVAPSALRHRFDIPKCEYDDKGIALLKTVQIDNMPYISDATVNAIYPLAINRSSAENIAIKSELMSALQSLEEYGFIYRSIFVFLHADDSESVSNYYELDCKINNKLKYNNELFCNKISDLAKQLGLESGRRDNRFYGEYFAIGPIGMNIAVSMVYRLKYAVTNPNNYRVSKAIKRRQECNAEVNDWIAKIKPSSNST